MQSPIRTFAPRLRPNQPRSSHQQYAPHGSGGGAAVAIECCRAFESGLNAVESLLGRQQSRIDRLIGPSARAVGGLFQRAGCVLKFLLLGGVPISVRANEPSPRQAGNEQSDADNNAKHANDWSRHERLPGQNSQRHSVPTRFHRSVAMRAEFRAGYFLLVCRCGNSSLIEIICAIKTSSTSFAKKSTCPSRYAELTPVRWLPRGAADI